MTKDVEVRRNYAVNLWWGGFWWMLKVISIHCKALKCCQTKRCPKAPLKSYEGGRRGKSNLGKWPRSESHSNWQAGQLDVDFFQIRGGSSVIKFSNFPWFAFTFFLLINSGWRGVADVKKSKQIYCSNWNWIHFPSEGGCLGGACLRENVSYGLCWYHEWVKVHTCLCICICIPLRLLCVSEGIWVMGYVDRV